MNPVLAGAALGLAALATSVATLSSGPTTAHPHEGTDGTPSSGHHRIVHRTARDAAHVDGAGRAYARVAPSARGSR
jgi:hypothetical protein